MRSYIKRDLKGFKCMTVRIDVLGNFSRLIKIFRDFQIIFRRIQSFYEYRNWINLNWYNLFYSILKSIEYIWISIWIQLNLFESVFESSWIYWNQYLNQLNLFEMNSSKVPTTTTIFKLIGPCESLSRSKTCLLEHISLCIHRCLF